MNEVKYAILGRWSIPKRRIMQKFMVAANIIVERSIDGFFGLLEKQARII
jgi:hypothetical protein